jgi:hypothetical protein
MPLRSAILPLLAMLVLLAVALAGPVTSMYADFREKWDEARDGALFAGTIGVPAGDSLTRAWSGPDARVLKLGGRADLVRIRYSAGRVALAASPPKQGAARVWIRQDGGWLSPDDSGEDVRRDEHGATYVDVDARRMYRIARGDGEHQLELATAAGGARLHSISILGP